MDLCTMCDKAKGKLEALIAEFLALEGQAKEMDGKLLELNKKLAVKQSEIVSAQGVLGGLLIASGQTPDKNTIADGLLEAINGG